MDGRFFRLLLTHIFLALHLYFLSTVRHITSEDPLRRLVQPFHYLSDRSVVDYTGGVCVLYPSNAKKKAV